MDRTSGGSNLAVALCCGNLVLLQSETINIKEGHSQMDEKVPGPDGKGDAIGRNKSVKKPAKKPHKKKKKGPRYVIIME